ncbi:prepilin-type N-terminal cleavage/methylation domain-containing protein [Ectobacillus sp. JY-23]|uniref:type IV pilus modification PilV family protein n=1 Tax=Ectobacillus sp. JY-23 TaxID=2933872 RepID=UPI001FF5D69D|nr:prepilin-type N-terminal cleavage/methylation domain-containing protein [Ectobacillus sp. JY-23]UOY92619.1 prepilin-type N-terminal cleavage/methylation domain-containing protein [Ectobacillus sp. JY-23]
MQKKSENGLTLIEVLTSITIFSIVTVGLFAVFPRTYMFTKENQTKTIAVNLARGALHYMEKQDYELLQGYVLALNNKPGILDTTSICKQILPIQLPEQTFQLSLFADETSCGKILAPTINNVTYDNKNIQIFLMPQNWKEEQIQSVMNHLKLVHPNTNFTSIHKQLTASNPQKLGNADALRIFVYVDLQEKDAKEGVLLEGSIAHEAIR